MIKRTNSATDVSIASILDDTADSIYNTKVYDYLTDGRLAGITYEDEDTANRSATHAVNYTYDDTYGRLKTMDDGIGTTTYSYNPYTTGKNGAGQLQSIDGPWENDTITYTYDPVGRLRKKTINDVNYLAGANYDKLDRLTSYNSLLGNFSQTYVGPTHRVKKVTSPVSTTTYNYSQLNKDFRLVKIRNQLRDSTNSNIEEFSYSRDLNGRIDSITQKIGSDAPLVKDYGYDALDQLTSAVISQGGSLQKHYAYTYDTAYNQSSKQVGEYSSTRTHNEVNEHEASTGGGPTRFYGKLDEPANVTINGEFARLESENYFEGFLDLDAGDHDVTVEATDGNGNVATETFNITVRSPDPASYTYDDEGNIITKTENGVTTNYRWDGENRLVSIAHGDQVSEFYYNGLSQRVRIVEKTNDVVTSDKRFIWCDSRIAEERNADNESTRYYFGNGETHTTNDANPGNYYYNVDHLGSTQSVLDSDGAIVARYEYTPYGEVTQTQGTLDIDFLYTGHYQHEPSNLFLTHYRAYDPTQGRWLSRDPIAENGGINLYAYVLNDPINHIDPDGRFAWIAAGAVIGSVINVGITYIANGGNVTGKQLAAAAVSGAISGAAGAVAGPLGGSIAKGLGAASNRLVASVAAGVLSGGGAALGQMASNLIDPCNSSSPLYAALYGGIGGGLAKGLFPTKNLNTWNQAKYFAPKTFSGLFGSFNAGLNLGSFAASSLLGGAANFQ